MDDRIDRIQRISARRDGLIGLAGGLPADELFPKEELSAAFVDVLHEPRCDALQYGWPEGSERLRSWIAERLSARGAAVEAEEVIITNGAQQALALATELIDVRGRKIVTDDETYPGALDLFRSRGARTIGVSASERIVEGDIAFHYVVPGASNPRGLGLPPARRELLLRANNIIVADEAYAELRFDGVIERPLIADARDRVLHIGTFSKTLSPGLRVGWLVVPPALANEALHRKHAVDLQAGSMAQAIVEAYLARADFDALLDRARATYELRTQRLVRAVRHYFPEARFVEPEGGFTIFVELDLDDVAEARALATATKHGTGFDPGSTFRPSGDVAPFAMRLSASRVDGVAVDEAVRRLAKAFDELRARRGARRAAVLACSTVTPSPRGSARLEASSSYSAATNSKRERSRAGLVRSRRRENGSPPSSRRDGSGP